MTFQQTQRRRQTMRPFSPLTWLCVCLTLGSATGSSNYLVQYEESASTYVDYPTDAASQALLATQPLDGEIPKVHLNLWTTPDDFRHPLFYLVKGIVRRLDKELILFQPSYYLQDGVTQGCRVIDPVTNQELENTDREDCLENCTNYGRYCSSSSPANAAVAAKISGASIVEESLRQLCVWVVYGKTGGDNMLHYFRYVNDLLFEQCDEPFGKNCTDSVMDRVGISPHFIERCMNHTHGVDSDQINGYLKEDVEHSKDVTPEMVPKLKIDKYWYDGEESTADIFQAICAAYPDDKQPIACDFCKDCDDVRYCLWHLQCGEQSFAEYAAAKQNNNYISDTQGSASSGDLNDNVNDNADPTRGENLVASSATANPPLDMASSPTNPAPDALRNDNYQEDERLTSSSGYNTYSSGNNDKKEAKDAIISGILVGLALGLVVSAVYGCRDYQARLILRELVKEEQAIKEKELRIQQETAPTSATSMLQRLQAIEAMIDGGRDVETMLDVNSERSILDVNSERSTMTAPGDYC